MPRTAGRSRRPAAARLGRGDRRDLERLGEDARRRSARQRRRRCTREALGLGRVGGVGSLGELGQHLSCEELHRLADVLVAVAPGLAHEDELVDTHVLVAADERPDLVGVDQLIFVSQAGRNRHEHICESMELFAREVMPEFAERADTGEAAKAERLGDAVSAALARRPPPRTLPEPYEVPAVPAP